MSALSHTIGGDLVLTTGAALATVSDAEETRQKILRRLCTNPGGYLWHLDYGAGLPAMVGKAMDAGTIQSVVQQQMATESGVDQTQPVTVTVTSTPSGLFRCDVSYTDSQTQTIQALTYQAS
ncbi:hypothetical protein [Gluconobacter oxydans]|uniref:Phage tail protein n=1 Tax=Gluconobacter oxydans (strain 621H) TaxID=290633 RepID=Q5FN84_GLUOX|nr:hypothetical protein [Gluconobacter oxydans]AAW62163.1 Hypothetical protein GOX2432 [Gluconobacter oxydans 621H]